jgi:hypothetical protein
LATPFSDIFTKFLKLLEDREIVVTLTDEELTDLLYGFLDQASSLYFKNCETDLTDYEEYDYYSQSFTATGSSADFIISQYPTSPDANAILYAVMVNGTETNAFTFTASTKTYHLTSTPTAGQIVICSYEFSGQFNQTLNSEEQWILANGMILGWLSGKMYNPTKLKERLSTTDWNSPHSPATLLKELKELYAMAENNLRNLVISYSFNGGHKFDE